MERNRRNEPSLLLDVWLLAQLTTRWLDERLPGSGLSADEFGFCSVLAEFEPMTSAEAAALTGLAPSTVASMLARLERRGLVQSEAHPSDRRARLWQLSPTGRGAFDQLSAAFAEAYAALSARMPQAAIGAGRAQMLAIEAALRSDLGLPTRAVSVPTPEGAPLPAADLSLLRDFEDFLRYRRDQEQV